jgi:hypothetical protein
MGLWRHAVHRRRGVRGGEVNANVGFEGAIVVVIKLCTLRAGKTHCSGLDHQLLATHPFNPSR